jgi:hypothetical protein
MFRPHNEVWLSICYNLQFGKSLLLLPCTALVWTLLPAAKINGSQLLQDFFFFFLAQSFKVPYFRSVRFGIAWPFDLDDQDSLREFGLRALSMHRSYNPLERWIFKVLDLAPRVLLFWTTEIYFGSSGFERFLLLARTIL